MRKIIIFILIALSANLLAEMTQADSSHVKRKMYKLEGISVIAERPEQSIGSISVKPFNPDESVMEVNVSESLNDISGLNLSVGGKSGSELSIRGFSEEQIKILIDGRPLSNSYMDAIDLTTIPLTNIKEIQVLKGPISSLYGSNTMGGVINILTKSPTRKRTIILGSQFRRNNSNKFYTDISQDFGLFDYAISASRYHTDGMVLSDSFEPTNAENGAIRNNNARTQYDFQSKLNFDLFDFHKIGLQFGYTNMPTKEITSNIYENSYRQYTNWERYQASASAFFQLLYNLEYNAQVYYDQYADTYVEYKDPEYTIMNSGWPSDLESWTSGTNHSFDWDINELFTLVNGFRYEKSAYNRKDNFWYPQWTSNSSQQINYYLQNEFNLDKLNFTIGSALSCFNIKGNKNWDYHIQPSAGLYYTFENNMKLSLASAINTTYPSLRQLFSERHGNEDLKEESGWKTELNVTKPFVSGRLSGNITTSLFYNNISNLIERLGDMNTNLKEVESYGFEAEAKIKIGWEHQLEYSYLKFAKQSDAELIGSPGNSVSIIESFQLPFGIKFKYKALWKDSCLTEDRNVILEPYWLHSVNFHKIVGRYKLGLGLNNLFDTNYQDQYRFPAEGFNFVFNCEVKL